MKQAKNTDFTKVFSKIHEGKWVALSSDRSKVIAYDSDILKLKEKVKNEKVVYTKVLPSDTLFAF